MPREVLTQRQQDVYNYIVRYATTHLYSPSISDICVGCSIKSRSDVWRYLRILEDKGYVRLGQHKEARAIKLNGFKLVEVEE